MFNEYPITKLDPTLFPPELLEIPQPPKELFIQGTLPPKNFIKLCVVGARKYSSYGKEVCEKLITGLRGYPVAIVSGLALGIDTIAHESALRAGLSIIAVPGSGLDSSVLYPRSNIGLAREILAKGGCLLSELEPLKKAEVWTFPQRNRIMVGLSKAVLIIEAEQKSGTLITARLATDYNRDVLTVPGSIFSANSEGPLLLLKLGATPVATSQDILDALGLNSKEENGQEQLFPNLEGDEKIVADNIASPLSRDELITILGWSAQRLGVAMTLLEIKGIIKESGGKIYLI